MNKNKYFNYDYNEDILYIDINENNKGIFITDTSNFLSGVVIFKNENGIITNIAIDRFIKRIDKGYIDIIVKNLKGIINKEDLIEIYKEIKNIS